MNVSSTRSAGPTTNVPIESLAAQSGLSERAKVAEASRQFEAALLRQILNEARKPVFASKFTQASAVNGIYDSMITSQLADSISQSGEFGLARSLQSQLARREPAATDEAADRARDPKNSQPPS